MSLNHIIKGQADFRNIIIISQDKEVDLCGLNRPWGKENLCISPQDSLDVPKPHPWSLKIRQEGKARGEN